MNKFVTKFAGFMLLVVLLVVASTATSCNKNKKCKAIITCLDLAGDPIAGAEVHCVKGDVDLVGTTDGSGTANFETDLPMILDIIVNTDTTGRVARFEEGQTDNVTVQ